MANGTQTPGQRLREARRKAGFSAYELGVIAATIAGRPRPISPSAIRNQENGTNGIPYPLAEAYAKALGTSAQAILFGPGEDGGLQGLQSLEDEYESRKTAEYFVARYGTISARWSEQSEGESDQDGLEIRVPGYSAEELRAYEADASLAPSYPKGSLILTAHHSHAGVYDRSHVVVTMTSGDLYLESLREIRLSGGGVELVGLGEKAQPPVDLRFQLGAPHIRIDQVVVATVNFLARPGTPSVNVHKLFSVPEDAEP